MRNNNNGERLRRALSPVATKPFKTPTMFSFGNNYVGQPLQVNKIMYQINRESQLDTNLASLDDDDDRLVIDLLDDDDEVRPPPLRKRTAEEERRIHIASQRRRMRNSVCVPRDHREQLRIARESNKQIGEFNYDNCVLFFQTSCGISLLIQLVHLFGS